LVLVAFDPLEDNLEGKLARSRVYFYSKIVVKVVGLDSAVEGRWVIA
jgi:hypothetical protein